MEVDAPRHPVGSIQSDEQLMAVTKERNKLRDQVHHTLRFEKATKVVQNLLRMPYVDSAMGTAESTAKARNSGELA